MKAAVVSAAWYLLPTVSDLWLGGLEPEMLSRSIEIGDVLVDTFQHV